MTDASSPTRVGRYAMFDRIAAGGMASVHVGRLIGEAGFSRTVAIKALHPQFALDPEFAEMFLDEARLAARIHHPNVVATLDVVRSQDQLYLVMEYVEGESLFQLLKMATIGNETVPLPIVSRIVAGALHGLHAAHEAKSDKGEPLGIVHRDVSPQNILVGVDGIARVLDFGVAKARHRAHTTQEGQLKGKLAYMAPEQVLSQAVTNRTDIFAAAVVLWESVAMRRLFYTESDAALIKALLDDPIEPPSKFRPEIPKALDDVIMRGLARNPADRFETAQEMADALEAAVHPGGTRETGAFVRRLGAERLRTRAELVARVESSSPGIESTRPPSTNGFPADLKTSVGVSRTDPGADMPLPVAKRSWALWGAIGAAVVVIGGTAGILSRSGSSAKPTVTAPAAAVVAPPPATNDTIPAPAPVPPPGATTDPAPTQSQVQTTAATAPKPATFGKAPGRPTAAPARSARPTPPSGGGSTLYSRD